VRRRFAPLHSLQLGHFFLAARRRRQGVEELAQPQPCVDDGKAGRIPEASETSQGARGHVPPVVACVRKEALGRALYLAQFLR
jgi:hypothetical protein